MKFIKTENSILYTPIVQYRRGKFAIKSIGTIHIGPSEYYDRLQEEISRTPEGFFEGIKDSTKDYSIPLSKRPFVKRVFGLRETYRNIAKYLGMEYQKDKLDYPTSWENPDMEFGEFVQEAPYRLLTIIFLLEKDINFIERLRRSGTEEVERKVNEKFRSKLTEYVESGISSLLMNALVSKRFVVDKRNQKLFNEIKPNIKGKTDGELGTVYGAAHLDGIDEFLITQGFTREGEEWIPAWDLNKILQ